MIPVLPNSQLDTRTLGVRAKAEWTLGSHLALQNSGVGIMAQDIRNTEDGLPMRQYILLYLYPLSLGWPIDGR